MGWQINPKLAVWLACSKRADRRDYSNSMLRPEFGPGGSPRAGSTPMCVLRSSNNVAGSITRPTMAIEGRAWVGYLLCSVDTDATDLFGNGPSAQPP